MDLTRTILELGQKPDMVSNILQGLITAIDVSALQATYARALLGNLLDDATVIMQLVVGLQPPAADASQRANKRAKVDRCEIPREQETAR